MLPVASSLPQFPPDIVIPRPCVKTSAQAAPLPLGLLALDPARVESPHPPTHTPLCRAHFPPTCPPRYFPPPPTHTRTPGPRAAQAGLSRAHPQHSPAGISPHSGAQRAAGPGRRPRRTSGAGPPLPLTHSPPPPAVLRIRRVCTLQTGSGVGRHPSPQLCGNRDCGVGRGGVHGRLGVFQNWARSRVIVRSSGVGHPGPAHPALPPPPLFLLLCEPFPRCVCDCGRRTKAGPSTHARACGLGWLSRRACPPVATRSRYVATVGLAACRLGMRREQQPPVLKMWTNA